MEPNIDNKDHNLDSRLSGKLMRLKDFVLQHGHADDHLMEVAAKIRPLPRGIAPSESFLQQMRQRLLQLGEPQGSQKAA